MCRVCDCKGNYQLLNGIKVDTSYLPSNYPETMLFVISKIFLELVFYFLHAHTRLILDVASLQSRGGRRLILRLFEDLFALRQLILALGLDPIQLRLMT